MATTSVLTVDAYRTEPRSHLGFSSSHLFRFLDAVERDLAEASPTLRVGFFAPAALVVFRFVVFVDGFFATAAFFRVGFLAALRVGFFAPAATLVVFRVVVFVDGFFPTGAFFRVGFLATLRVGFFAPAAALLVFRFVVFVDDFFAAFFCFFGNADAGFAFRFAAVGRFLAAPIAAPESAPGSPRAVPATAPATAPLRVLPVVPVALSAVSSFLSSSMFPQLFEKRRSRW
jgi:hypothetical protein